MSINVHLFGSTVPSELVATIRRDVQDERLSSVELVDKNSQHHYLVAGLSVDDLTEQGYTDDASLALLRSIGNSRSDELKMLALASDDDHLAVLLSDEFIRRLEAIPELNRLSKLKWSVYELMDYDSTTPDEGYFRPVVVDGAYFRETLSNLGHWFDLAMNVKDRGGNEHQVVIDFDHQEINPTLNSMDVSHDEMDDVINNAYSNIDSDEASPDEDVSTDEKVDPAADEKPADIPAKSVATPPKMPQAMSNKSISFDPSVDIDDTFDGDLPDGSNRDGVGHIVLDMNISSLDSYNTEPIDTMRDAEFDDSDDDDKMFKIDALPKDYDTQMAKQQTDSSTNTDSELGEMPQYESSEDDAAAVGQYDDSEDAGSDVNENDDYEDAGSDGNENDDYEEDNDAEDEEDADSDYKEDTTPIVPLGRRVDANDAGTFVDTISLGKRVDEADEGLSQGNEYGSENRNIIDFSQYHEDLTSAEPRMYEDYDATTEVIPIEAMVRSIIGDNDIHSWTFKYLVTLPVIDAVISQITISEDDLRVLTVKSRSKIILSVNQQRFNVVKSFYAQLESSIEDVVKDLYPDSKVYVDKEIELVTKPNEEIDLKLSEEKDESLQQANERLNQRIKAWLDEVKKDPKGQYLKLVDHGQYQKYVQGVHSNFNSKRTQSIKQNKAKFAEWQSNYLRLNQKNAENAINTFVLQTQFGAIQTIRSAFERVHNDDTKAQYEQTMRKLRDEMHRESLVSVDKEVEKQNFEAMRKQMAEQSRQLQEMQRKLDEANKIKLEDERALEAQQRSKLENENRRAALASKAIEKVNPEDVKLDDTPVKSEDDLTNDDTVLPDHTADAGQPDALDEPTKDNNVVDDAADASENMDLGEPIESNEYPDDSDEDEYPDDTEEDEHPDDADEDEYPDDADEDEYPDDADEDEYPDDADEDEYPDDTEGDEYLDDADEDGVLDLADEIPASVPTQVYEGDDTSDEAPQLDIFGNVIRSTSTNRSSNYEHDDDSDASDVEDDIPDDDDLLDDDIVDDDIVDEDNSNTTPKRHRLLGGLLKRERKSHVKKERKPRKSRSRR